MKPNKISDFESEYYKLKKNNRGLAKALADEHQINKKLFDEVNMLQRKLYVSSNKNMQYEKAINELIKSLKHNLDGVIDLTNNLGKTLILCTESKNIRTSVNDNNNVNTYNRVSLRSVSPTNKTHAVKPMVSGHVIHHPTINLSRLVETRVSASQTIDSTVQNNSNIIENNHEEENRNIDIISTNHLPIRGYVPSIDNDTDESLDDSMSLEDESSSNEITNHTVVRRSLDTVIEYSDEDRDSPSPNSSILKEVRILIEPLHLDEVYPYRRSMNARSGKSKAKRHVDPLEGTSSMLDESGNLVEYNNYISKPRLASNRLYFRYEHDSDSEDSYNSKKDSKRWITKRKVLNEKKDVTGQKYKVKRSRISENGNVSSTNTSPDRSNEENNISSSFEELVNIQSRRSRRSVPKNLAEPSLKKKLRR